VIWSNDIEVGWQGHLHREDFEDLSFSEPPIIDHDRETFLEIVWRFDNC